MVLTLTGKEKVKWTERHVSNDSGSTWHSKKLDIINQTFDIYHFKGGVCRPGQYTYPFSFMLPDYCPSSILKVGASSSKARIRYNLIAEVI